MIDVIHDAYENARFLCEQYYLVAPSLVVREHNSIANGEPISKFISWTFQYHQVVYVIVSKYRKLEIVYVPSHLYHMVFELFKNSLRAGTHHNNLNIFYPENATF